MTVRSPTPEQISARAYQIYLERGRIPGHEMDDWLQAEYELMQLPVRKLAEMEPQFQIARGKPKRKTLVDLVRASLY
ncbi:MAG TPA: DUF2934 domain-containing protein [Verrucomicrobiae bacterium]|nr:DUF2934 domain-containing protein [Verrucomicrobiae bacterium]